MLVAVLGFASEAAAVLYDLNVANGNYNVAANWIDHSTSTSRVPTELDGALVRNGGTLNITAADGDINSVHHSHRCWPADGSCGHRGCRSGTSSYVWRRRYSQLDWRKHSRKRHQQRRRGSPSVIAIPPPISPIPAS